MKIMTTWSLNPVRIEKQCGVFSPAKQRPPQGVTLTGPLGTPPTSARLLARREQ